MKYGLIGEKLSHSYSKIIHEKLADYTYDLCPLTKNEIHVLIEQRESYAIEFPWKGKMLLSSEMGEEPRRSSQV